MLGYSLPTLIDELAAEDARANFIRVAELLRRDLETFGTLEAVDTRIPIRETRSEVATSAQH
jgi:hypothetical protein